MADLTYELRSATADDFDAVADLWYRSASLPAVGPAAMPTKADLRRRVDEEMAAGWQVTVAAAGERILAFLALQPREARLAELFVSPAVLSKGIGRALLDHAKAAIPGGFTLYTRSANGRARRFYEREGLAALREDIHPRSGDPITWYAWPAPADTIYAAQAPR